MLHNEARRMLVQAYEETHNAQAVGKAYFVSKWTVYHLSEQMHRTGSVDLRVSARGRKRKLNADDIKHIDKAVQEQPDITIQEINEKLQLEVSDETVRRAVVQLGYTYKKKMIHASEQERPRCTGRAQTMGENHE